MSLKYIKRLTTTRNRLIWYGSAYRPVPHDTSPVPTDMKILLKVLHLAVHREDREQPFLNLSSN